ncbi:hypothetical protein [Ectobacillus panaciterrae]|uniref:hypothetical protein n=1 Tax=Ectobacillus panaciterrae TaxID=363872 RepID=UPI001FE01868
MRKVEVVPYDNHWRKKFQEEAKQLKETKPKSVTPSRIEENSDIFDFELSAEDVAQIDALNEERRVGPDPDNFDF